MRAILFRGMRIDNGEWVEGDFCSPCNICCKIIENGEDVWDDKSVVAETVGQFTGLTDKKGKRIFEGDVIAYDNSPQGYVIFHEGEFMLQGIKPKKITSLKKYAYLLEVIGNAYDNPELLEV